LKLFEKTIRRLRNGVKISILHSPDFQAWFWKKVNILTPVECIKDTIFFGFVPFKFIGDFNIPIRDCVLVGIPKEETSMYRKATIIRKPPDMRAKLETHSNYVFGLDYINKIRAETDLLIYIQNLTKYSDKYIFVTCWAMDPEVPEVTRTRDKIYWDLDRYVDVFKEQGFVLTVRANYKDSLTMLYVFEKFR